VRTVRIPKLLLLLLVLVAARATAQTCDFTWTGGGGNNNWSTPANWNPTGPPGSGTNVCFGGNGTVTANVNSSVVVGQLNFSGNGTFNIIGDPLATLQINAGLTGTGNASFNLSTTEPVVLGASQTWNIAVPAAPVVNSGLRALSGTEVLTKTGSTGLTLAGASFPLGGIVYGGGGTLTVTAVNGLGSATPVSLATGSFLLLSSGSVLNLDNDVTVTGASGTATVAVTSTTAGTRHTLGLLTVPAGASLTQGTSGATNTSLQIAGLTLNGASTLTKTSLGNGGLWIAGPVTSTSAATIVLEIAITTPTTSQYDQGIHFTSNTTVAAGFSTSGNGNSAFLGADGATTVTLTGPVSFGSGNPRAILIGRTGGRLVFGPSSFSTTNQDSQIRGDSTGVIEFSSAAAANNRVSIFDGASWQTDVNTLPTRITFQPTAGGRWLVRGVNQSTANNAIVQMDAAGTIDTGANLNIAGALQGSGALTKIGAGTLTFTDFNNYTGAVTVSAGTLVLGGNSNNATQSFAVNAGAALSGSGSTDGPVSFAALSNLSPGVGMGLGNTTLNDTTNLNFTVGSATTSVSTGTLALDGVLNITAGAGFGQGNFTLFSATAPPTNGGLRLGSAPATNTYLYDITGNNVILTVGPPVTAVELVKLDAVTNGIATQVSWESGTEVRNLGYRIFREENGRFRDVSGLIAGSALRGGFDPLAGRNYAFTDTGASTGGRYWVQAIDMRGHIQWFGPVDARRGPAAQFRTSSAALRTGGSGPMLLAGSGARQVDFPEVTRSWRDANLSRQWEVARSPGAVKLRVRKDGVYRVRADQLFQAGLPAGTPLTSVQLWAGGRQVAFRLSPSGDAIEFFGQAADTRYTDTRVYWVTTGLGRPELIEPAPAAAVNARQTSFVETLEIRDRTTHIPALLNPDTDGFFGKFLIGAEAMERIFSTPALAFQASDPAVLEVSLQGLTNGEHLVDVRVNGLVVGTIHGVFQDVTKARFTLPPGALLPGDNSVTLTGRTDEEIAVELSQRLIYPRQYSFSGALRFTAPAGADLVLSGADSSTRVLDVTAVLHPTAVAASASSGGMRIVAGGTGTRILYAYRDQDVLTPAVVPNVPSSWNSGAQGADLVIIGNGQLLPSLRPLVEQRTREGLRVAVVDIEDVYNEFSAGEKDAMAIRAFLSHAVRNWAIPPSFVLLAGPATYDPRGWLGHPELDQVPTALIQTRYLATASDDALVTFDAVTGPGLAIGRLPLSTAEEMDAAVAKILGRRLATRDGSLLFVRDRDGNVSFSAASAEVRSAFSGWKTQDFARGADDAATHADLVAALRAGPLAVDFQGHGAEDLWAGRILNTSDAEALAGSGAFSLLVAATCLNAYFVDIGRESLGSALLRTPDGGAWGVWASSAMTLPTEHGRLSKTLLSAALEEGLTLGEATLKAKQAVSDADVRASFHLLGDPSARAIASRGSALTTGGSKSGAFGCSTPGAPLGVLAPLVLAVLVIASRRRRAS
jgi:autotransporter-associated beta strand protein